MGGYHVPHIQGVVHLKMEWIGEGLARNLGTVILIKIALKVLDRDKDES